MVSLNHASFDCKKVIAKFFFLPKTLIAFVFEILENFRKKISEQKSHNVLLSFGGGQIGA